MNDQDSVRGFSEPAFENAAEQREHLLHKQIADLGLKLEGTRLEKLVQELYRELETAGIRLRPPVYLAGEWGCPEGKPIIGVPFYLADEKLSRLESEIMEGIEGETDEEIMRYLRHEAGHALNYAYTLYKSDEWRDIFGPYSRPYQDDYIPNPFSRNFVRHIAGWYAQKHPDEDFAETFAVWLTPGSTWREDYRGWGCYAKLLYVERIVRDLGKTPPLVSADDYDIAQEALHFSLAEYNRRFGPVPVEVGPYFDSDLRDIFGVAPSGDRGDWMPADRFLEAHRRHLVDHVNYWTGVSDSVVRSLVNHFIERCRALKLWVNPATSGEALVEVTAYTTTLCMNRLYKGDFVIA
jgi:hypothetical protein